MRLAQHGRQNVNSDLLALESIDLGSLQEVADLQRRFDRKYLLPVDRLPELLATLQPGLRVLEVADVRQTDYTSVYFDTPDLRTFRDHLKRRRRRFKVRTRQYGDPRTAMLEVKCKGRRGQTIKHRWPHPGVSPAVLGSEGHHRVADAIDAQYGLTIPASLRPTAVIRFSRITLVRPQFGERITIDLDLSVEVAGRTTLLGTNHAIVETKQPRRRGRSSTALSTLGLRPSQISKYCLGVVARYPQVRGNPWLPVLRQLQGGAAGS